MSDQPGRRLRSSIEGAAERLWQAHRMGQPCAPIRELVSPNTAETGYAIQELNTKRWLAEGRRLVGRKIGLTSPAVQSQMKVDQPDFGMLFEDMLVGSDEPIARGRLMQPQLEGEVAFVLARDLTDEGVDRAGVRAAIDHALVAGEIVDSRIADWDITIVDTVADNASSGLYVLGEEKVPLSRLDFLASNMRIERRGDIVSAGTGAACLGHPLDAVVWLARTLLRVGRPLQAGDLVLSGAWGPLVRAWPGDRLTLSITGLGSVVAHFQA